MERLARWTLVLLVLAELLLLSRQVSRRGENVPLLEGATVGILGPAARGVDSVEEGLGTVGRTLKSRKSLREENSELRQRVVELEREMLRLQSLEGDFLRLGEAVRYARRRSDGQLQVADVVYADYTSWLRSLLLFTGEGGASRNQPVVHEEGLVGRVVATGGAYAKVQLITDRTSAVGAMIERSGRQGVVRGDGAAGLELDYVPLQADVLPGDRVVTAGIDGIYPRGIPIGAVREVKPGTQLFHRIEVVPLVDFGSLDHVYLLAALPEARTLSESLAHDLR